MTPWKQKNLFDPTQHWFETYGYEIYANVKFYGRRLDFVAIKDRSDGRGKHVVMAAMNRVLTEQLAETASASSYVADQSYAVISSGPSSKLKDRVQWCKDNRVSIIRITNGKMDMLHICGPSPKEPVLRQRLFEVLSNCKKGGVAGAVYANGKGPAVRCLNRVREYRAMYPDATWDKMWQKLPNHYANPHSMAAALRYIERQLEGEDDEHTGV
jgi:hypothetical protein